MNPLEQERKISSFDTQELGHYIYGGKERFESVMKIYKTVSEDPILKNDVSMLDKGRLELFKDMTLKTKRMHEIFNIGTMNMQDFGQVWNHFISQLHFSVHFGMFMPYIRTMGTPEQVQKWIPRSENLEIVGAYAQTEMGHGSDVQSLETTATFDSKTDEFVIHSPTLTSTKWWPGELGFTANHCVCFAQLIIDGKKHGIQSFIVPLRDIETHKPLKGITIGDIGPKLGYITKDNGFVKFDNVRIPRDNMLMKYFTVSRDGKTEKKGNPRISYATMMLIRDVICHASWKWLAHALTISIRYSICRTQFKGSDGQELKVLDYQTQQEKIFPYLAASFAMNAGAHRLTEMANENLARVQKNDFSFMPDVHGALAGCKTFYTWETEEGIAFSRQSCGGHGFNSYSGFTPLENEFHVNPTHEGENSIMALQTARYLIGSIQKIQSGKHVSHEVDYLARIPDILEGIKCSATKSENFNLDLIHDALQVTSAWNVYSAAAGLMEASKKNGDPKEAWNKDCGVDLLECARTHIYLWTFRAFLNRIQKVKCSALKKHLEALCALYGLEKLIRYPQGGFASGYFSPSHVKMLKQRKAALFKEIRPAALNLIESFAISDNSLKSALGGSGGKPYETLWEWVNKHNDFNKIDFSGIWEKDIKSLRGPKPKL